MIGNTYRLLGDLQDLASLIETALNERDPTLLENWTTINLLGRILDVCFGFHSSDGLRNILSCYDFEIDDIADLILDRSKFYLNQIGAFKLDVKSYELKDNYVLFITLHEDLGPNAERYEEILDMERLVSDAYDQYSNKELEK